MATALHIVKQFFPKVTKVTDASKDAMVEVTKRDSNSAQVRNHGACAMAVACKRTFDLTGVIVSVDRAYLIKGDEAIRYVLPPSVSREVVSFDRNGGFDEGKYQLSAVPKSAKVGTYRGQSYTNGKSHNGNLKKRFRHQTGGVRIALGSKRNPLAVSN